MAVTIDGFEVDLPPTWAETQLAQAFEESVVGQLTQSTPLPLGESVIPVYEGGFEVGYTAEGSPKPVSEVGFDKRTLSPWKFAGIILVSKEAARLNPARMLENIQADMRNGVSRQIDYGVFYGKSARTGNAVPNATYIDQTSARISVGLDLAEDVLDAYDAAVEGNPNGDPNGFAFDTRYRTRIARANAVQNTVGATIPAIPNLTGAGATVGGLPAAYGRTVSGRVGTQTDTGRVGFVGDWTKGLTWGFATSIELQRSTEATIVDGAGKTWHAFQDNMIAYLIEFTAGWSVNPTMFAAIDGVAPDESSCPPYSRGACARRVPLGDPQCRHEDRRRT